MRKTALVRKTPLTQGKPLRRVELGRDPKAAGLKRSGMKQRRYVPSPEETHAKDTVTARSGGVCELHARCGGAYAVDWSHRLRKSQGGRWCPSNGMAACRACHALITEHETSSEAVRYGWALKSGMDPEACPAYRRGEWVWLHPDGDVTPLTRPEIDTWLEDL